MNKNKLHILLLLLTWACVPLLGQESEALVRNILAELQQDIPGQGMIRIFQSPAIAAVVGTRSGSIAADPGQRHQILQGYRVQVYSGNAANSKSIAADRAAQVREHFPELESETIYNAPFWRVQVGNFVTREEAQDYLDRIKEAFPTFGKGMYVVRTNIKIPL